MFFIESTRDKCQSYAPRIDLFVDTAGVKYIELSWKTHVIRKQFNKKNIKYQVEMMTIRLCAEVIQNERCFK